MRVGWRQTYPFFILYAFGTAIGSCRVNFIGYSSRYRVNHVFLKSIFSGAPFCYLSYIRSIQYGGIFTSLINGNVENGLQTPHEI